MKPQEITAVLGDRQAIIQKVQDHFEAMVSAIEDVRRLDKGGLRSALFVQKLLPQRFDDLDETVEKWLKAALYGLRKPDRTITEMMSVQHQYVFTLLDDRSKPASKPQAGAGSFVEYIHGGSK